MCLYPKLIRNKRYTPTKKNGGVIPPLQDPRTLWIPAACGKCMECCKQRANEWNIRLKEEIKGNKEKAYFMTYTFSDEGMTEIIQAIKKKRFKLEGYDLDNEICTLATRRYLERWRKKYKKSLRHWLVTEIGQTKTERIHMHGIVWTNQDPNDLKHIWKYGIADIGKLGVSEISAGYLTKYMTKIDPLHKEFKSKVLTSPGIGKHYMERTDWKNNIFKGNNTNTTYRDRRGFKQNLPIYYRNKIYTENEKEKLWIQMLDKDERWVNGVKVDVSETDEEYFKLLAEARNLNKRYGFGDDKINWERKRYERDKRNLKRKQIENRKKNN